MHAPIVEPLLVEVVYVCILIDLRSGKLEAISYTLIAASFLKYEIQHGIPQFIRHPGFVCPFQNSFYIRHGIVNRTTCGIINASSGNARKELCKHIAGGSSRLC